MAHIAVLVKYGLDPTLEIHLGERRRGSTNRRQDKLHKHYGKSSRRHGFTNHDDRNRTEPASRPLLL